MSVYKKRQTAKTKALVLAAVTTLLAAPAAALDGIAPKIQSCQSDNFYDTATYKCQKCGTNAIQDPKNVSECTCPEGFHKKDDTRFDFLFECQQCDPTLQEAPNSKSTGCKTCSGDAVYDPVEKACICPEGSRATDIDFDGFELAYIICEVCPGNTYRGPAKGRGGSIWECEACPHFAMIYNEKYNPWKCECDESQGWTNAGNTCVRVSDEQDLENDGFLDGNKAYKMTYYNMINAKGEVTEDTVDSDVFSHFYLESAIGCRTDSVPQKCQTLANLCVLQLYNEQTTACKLYKEELAGLATTQTQPEIAKFYNDGYWVDQLPWLYYEQTPEEVLYDAKPIDLTVSFFTLPGDKTRTQYLTYFLARYSIDGNFLGYQELKDQLSLCPMTFNDVMKMKQFGVVTQNICEFELNQLVQEDPEKLPQEANAFFELFIQDRNGDLVDVPVLITNFRDYEDAEPNLNIDRQNSRLVRRFFLYDTISGIDSSGGFVRNAIPKIVRYASSVKLTVQLDPNVEEHIRRPLLAITYQEKLVKLISEDSPGEEVVYFMDYFEETSKLWNTSRVILIVSQVLIGIVVLVRTYFFMQHNPKNALGSKFWGLFAFKFVYFALDIWSSIMFWELFLLNMYWFTMYKMQDNAFLLLPSTQGLSSAYDFFGVFFLIILVMRTLVILMKIFDQSRADLFLMDWEEHKNTDQYELRREAEAKKGPQVSNVIAWRSTFITNEFNEMQTEVRKIQPETTLIWFGFFWVGLGWQWIAQTNPDFEEVNKPLEPFNDFLKFFLCAFLFLFIAAVQFILYLLYNTIEGNLVTRFCDLCSVSNVSVLVMTQPFYGYYINGKAPWSHSDLPLAWLKKELDAEREGKRQNRGFGAQQQDVANGNSNSATTSFEIYMTKQMRQKYDELMQERNTPLVQDVVEQPVVQESSEAGTEEAAQPTAPNDKGNESSELVKKQPKKGGKKESAIDKAKRQVKVNQEEVAKYKMNLWLTSEFRKVDFQKPNNIHVRNCMERLFQKVPADFRFDKPAVSGAASIEAGDDIPFHLVKDPLENYPSLSDFLYQALDWQIVIFEILWWFFIDKLTGNPVIALVVVYILERVLREIRATLGKVNIVKKTFVNECFLN